MGPVTITFQELTNEQANALTKLASGFTKVEKPGKPEKPHKTEDNIDDQNVDDPEDFGGDDEVEEPPAKPTGKKKLTVDDVIEALQAYAEANTRDAAKKIVASFKVKSVHDLKETDYAKVIAKLK